MSVDLEEGWGFPGASKKAHYFVGGRSLCLKWMFLGRLEPTDGVAASPDDCVSCGKKAAARRESGSHGP